MTEASHRPVSHRRSPLRAYRRISLATLLGVLLIGLVAGTGLAGDPRLPHRSATIAEPEAPPSGALPFDLPSPRELRGSPHLAFAHYFPPYPLSLDNKPAARDYYSRNYLAPDGESGKHAAYGGLLRDRPAPVGPRPGDWRLAGLEQEVRTARDAGLDGFSVDILSLTGPNWDRVRLLMRAAHEADPSFRIMLMPDMTSLHTDPRTLADALAALADSPAAHRLPDGRLVVSPFKAEARSADWWSEVMSRLRQRHGISTALVPLFLDFRAHAERFASISYGFSEWGSRSFTGQAGTSGRAALAHRLGKRWMQPVSVQDSRPNQAVYDEAGNTATLRTTWSHAIDDGADWVQLTTWNDYAEGSHFAPSLHNGHSYLDLSAYYLTRFKTGKWPEIVRDTVYITSRVQFAADPTASRQSRLMLPREGTARPRDEVEVLTFLTAPATLDITVGRAHHRAPVPAGVRPTAFPLRPGLAKAVVRRGGQTVVTANTRYPVRTDVEVQDLQYYGVTSGRDE